MSEFDLESLDNMDFDEAEKAAKERQKEMDEKAAEEVERLSKDAGKCVGGSCTI